MSKPNNRRIEKEELILKNNNITWEHPYGYVRDWDEESGIPCSVGDVMTVLEAKH